MLDGRIIAIQAFARLFATSELYDTGYSDPVTNGGLASCETIPDAIKSLAYVHGYADACRLASPYQGSHWRVAHLMSIACGMLAACLEADDSEAKIVRLLGSYRSELSAELDRTNGRPLYDLPALGEDSIQADERRAGA